LLGVQRLNFWIDYALQFLLRVGSVSVLLALGGADLMMALLQRVRQARVEISGQVCANIGAGLLVLLCAEVGDTPEHGRRMLAKILKLRVFADASGKMNHSVQDMDGHGQAGGLLIVSQFTLAADTARGNRPGFTGAAEPALGQQLYLDFVALARQQHGQVQTGEFGADMQVHLVNDGPVTIPLRIAP
jgi:D-tyrosyl-tRNA(Tyr) deacylase